ncbi:hypothetical protein DZJ_03790 [Dickeya ananatis]
MIYTTSAICLLLFGHRPTFRTHARIYLLLGGALFVSYEICFSLSIGMAQNRLQAMELGMINYLWPCLTILFSLFINQQKKSIMAVAGPCPFNNRYSVDSERSR